MKENCLDNNSIIFYQQDLSQTIFTQVPNVFSFTVQQSKYKRESCNVYYIITPYRYILNLKAKLAALVYLFIVLVDECLI